MLFLKNDTVFITGGSGFIGRNVLRALRTHGVSVKALARSERSAEIVRSLGATAIKGDLMDFEALKIGMQDCSHLIHTAADTNHGASTPAQEEANLQGARNVFGAAKIAGIHKALHLSTEAVLLTGKPLCNADETTPMPKSFAGGYSRTKAGAERIALESAGKNMEVMVVRPRFVWGRDDTTALPQLIEAAQSGKLAWIGGGNYLISTTHIANAVEGMLLALTKGRSGEVYFITDGKSSKFREFISALLTTQNIDAPTKQMPRWVVVSAVRLGEIASRLTGGKLNGPMSWQEYATLGDQVTLNIDKARTELGYEPIITIEQGLEELTNSFWKHKRNP